MAQGTSNPVQDTNLIRVNGVSQLTGSGATGTGSERVTVAVDSATVAGSASLPTGSNVIGHVIADSGSTTAVTGNVTAIQGTGTNLHTVVDSGTITVGNASGGSAVNIQDGGNSITIDGAVVAAGDVASDGIDSGNPIKIGLQARTTDPTAVANADRVNAIGDTLGKQVVLLGAVHDRIVTGTTNYTNDTAADVIALVASNRIVVMSILVTNAHATVSTKVEIRDGTTVKIIGQAQATGGGFSMGSGYPLFIGTSGAAVTARCVTTGAHVNVSISGYTITN